MATYAQKAGGGGGKKRKKLNVLDIVLERRNPEISYNLSKEELSKLLFKKMKIQASQIAKIDTSGFGKIHVEMKADVKLERFIELPVFDIREGLRTKFYRPHHRKDILVKVSWLDLETPDELLLHVLSFFGNPKSGVQYCTMQEEEGESELAKLLNKIPNGERQVWMEINTPLPSYAVIDGRRVKVWHIGQKRTCARCNMDVDSCPGKANARHCEDNGGAKTKTEDMWKTVLESVKYSEWDGEEVKIVVEKTNAVDDASENSFEGSDGIVLSNIEENATEEDIKSLLRAGMEETDIEKVLIEKMGNNKSRLITSLPLVNITPLSKMLNRKMVNGNMIHCKPHVPKSPPTVNPVEEPTATNATEEKSKENETAIDDKPKEKETGARKKVKQNQSQLIPGLPEALRVKKKKNKKDKKQKSEVDTKKVSDLKATDFLFNNASENTSIDDFVFENADDSDAFEDSREDLSDIDDEPSENFLTPINFKSNFGRRLSVSGSVSDLTFKRDRDSPGKETENKKSRSSSVSQHFEGKSVC